MWHVKSDPKVDLECLQVSAWDWHYYHPNNTKPFKGEGSGEIDVDVYGEALSYPTGC